VTVVDQTLVTLLGAVSRPRRARHLPRVDCVPPNRRALVRLLAVGFGVVTLDRLAPVSAAAVLAVEPPSGSARHCTPYREQII
jgi:hypothetical protein